MIPCYPHTEEGLLAEIARAYAAASPRGIVARLWHRFMFRVYLYIDRYGNYVSNPVAYAHTLESQLNRLYFRRLTAAAAALDHGRNDAVRGPLGPGESGDAGKLADGHFPDLGDVVIGEDALIAQSVEYPND